MLDKIRKKLLGDSYVEVRNLLEKQLKTNHILLDLLHEVKVERDDLKMELAEAYTYMAELKAKAEGKGD